MNEFELKRLKTIQRNKEYLESLNLLDTTSTTSTNTKTKTSKSTTSTKTNSKRSKDLKPLRSSKRLNSSQPPPSELQVQSQVQEVPSSELQLHEKLLHFEEYFSKEVIDKAIKSDGKFRGTINPSLLTDTNTSSNTSNTKNTKKIKGWSKAKQDAFNLRSKNPNAYYYRHTQVGIKQHYGDWTTQEQDLFLKTAKEFGSGNQWGLFSTFIPHRVGYQCANYYRVLLGKGLVYDPCYKYTTSGSVVYSPT